MHFVTYWTEPIVKRWRHRCPSWSGQTVRGTACWPLRIVKEDSMAPCAAETSAYCQRVSRASWMLGAPSQLALSDSE